MKGRPKALRDFTTSNRNEWLALASTYCAALSQKRPQDVATAAYLASLLLILTSLSVRVSYPVFDLEVPRPRAMLSLNEETARAYSGCLTVLSAEDEYFRKLEEDKVDVA